MGSRNAVPTGQMKEQQKYNVTRADVDEFLAGTLSRDRINEVREWMKTRQGQSYVSSLMDRDISAALNGEKLSGTPDGATPHYGALLAGINRSIKRRRLVSFAAAAAAVLLPLLVMNFFLLSRVMEWGANTTAYEEVCVPAGEQLKLLLHDGTRITLNSGAALQYPARFSRDNRTVRIEGEGWFEVAKEKRPFIVQTATVDVRVLGTDFNVSTDSGGGEMSVYLATGLVRISEKISGQSGTITLHPGETAYFQKSTGLCYVEKQSGNHTADEWRHKRYHFKDAPLAELLASIEKNYGVTFELTSDELYRYTYTISFFNESLDDIINAMEQITPIKCVRLGDRIIISPDK